MSDISGVRAWMPPKVLRLMRKIAMLPLIDEEEVKRE